MNLIWRFLYVILFSRFYPKASWLDETEMTFTVLPTDVDVLMHMNNGRYFSLMDLGRMNLVIRLGIIDKLTKQQFYPVIASEMIRFRRSLNLFKRFQLTSRIIGWDDKFFYVVQYFKRNNDIHALSLIKARFLQRGNGPVTPAHLLALVNMTKTSPALPEWVFNWEKADKAFYDESILSR
jgi:acyl-CoA thioesterase FadM